ncbi:MAG: hypothetical protein QM831_26160 [Kofleriaceae bacterium]
MIRVLALVLLLGCHTTDRKKFADSIEPAVTDLMCDVGKKADDLPIYYRMCFDVDEPTCIATMRPLIHTCTLQLLPQKLDEKNAADATEQIGACAGEKYEAQLAAKWRDTDTCQTARASYAKARNGTLAGSAH